MTTSGASFFLNFDAPCNEVDPHCITKREAGIVPGASVPPAPQGRHAASDPRETLSKELIQCQNCLKPSTTGIKLFRCAGCQTDLYCSKACQKSAWPTHKATCRLNQREGSGKQIAKDLRNFCSKHCPTLAEAACTALDIHRRPENARENVLLIELRRRSGTTQRKETLFFAETARVVPISALGDGMEGDVVTTDEMVKRSGLQSAFHVVLWCSHMMLTVPIGFPSMDDLGPPMPEWRPWLLKRLNDGIVS